MSFGHPTALAEHFGDTATHPWERSSPGCCCGAELWGFHASELAGARSPHPRVPHQNSCYGKGFVDYFFLLFFFPFSFFFFFSSCAQTSPGLLRRLWHIILQMWHKRPWLQNISGMAVGSVVQSPSTYGNHREILLKRGSGPIHHSSRSHVPLSGSAGGPEAPGAFPPRGCSTAGMGRMGPLCWHPAAWSRSLVLPVVSCHCTLLSSIWWCCYFSATGQNPGGFVSGHAKGDG